jgi:uncharacterized membrane protein YdbT with pleckstrin-like domain
MEIEDTHQPPAQANSAPDPECEFVPEGIILNEVQLLLAEKRTSLSAMRTGIAVFVLPLSVLSVLIATSKYYDVLKVMPLIVPLLGICAALIVLGSYLILRAIVRMRHLDDLILRLKRKHQWIAQFID